MSADFVFHNIYPPSRLPSEDEFARLFAAEAEEGFDAAREKGMMWMKVRRCPRVLLGWRGWGW